MESPRSHPWSCSAGMGINTIQINSIQIRCDIEWCHMMSSDIVWCNVSWLLFRVRSRDRQRQRNRDGDRCSVLLDSDDFKSTSWYCLPQSSTWCGLLLFLFCFMSSEDSSVWIPFNSPDWPALCVWPLCDLYSSVCWINHAMPCHAMPCGVQHRGVTHHVRFIITEMFISSLLFSLYYNCVTTHYRSRLDVCSVIISLPHAMTQSLHHTALLWPMV